MHFNLGLSRTASAAPPSSLPAKSLQTTTPTANDRSDRPAPTNSSLLPPPATAKDRQSRPRRNSKSVQIRSGGWRIRWAAFKKQIGSGTAPSSSSTPDDSIGSASYVHKPQESSSGDRDGQVDVVVVDRLWGEGPGWSTNSESNEETHAENRLGTTNTDPNSSEVDNGFWGLSPAFLLLRWRIWPSILGFFLLRFPDHKFEVHYSRETWFLRKRLALLSAAFFVMNWLLPVILITRPVTLADAIFYYGVSARSSLNRPSLSLTPQQVGPAISVPLVFLVIFDYPRDRSFFYQTYLLFAVWSWPLYQVAYMYVSLTASSSSSDHLSGICVVIGTRTSRT